MQLCHYRGLFDFQVSPWITQAGALLDHMTAVRCEAGGTQILRVLAHAIAAGTTTNPIRALVFIGDACEESTESLLQLAGQCAIIKLPVFIFHEGHDHRAGTIFRQIADLSRGAYAPFDASSADQLRLLLGAVSRYASGGIKALLESNGDGDKILIEQLRRF